jgi:hypothetical protein
LGFEETMLPKNWPSAFQYSPVPISQDLHENLLQRYFLASSLDRKEAEEKRVHLDLEIQKISSDFFYRNSLHPLAGQDAFEGHAQHGVFATKRIAKGTPLGEYVGEVFLTKRGLTESAIGQKGFYCWHLLFKDLWIHIYSGRIANELTFVNDFHGLAEKPNVRGQWRVSGGFYYFGYESMEEIEPKEEILIDYHSKKLLRVF